MAFRPIGVFVATCAIVFAIDPLLAESSQSPTHRAESPGAATDFKSFDAVDFLTVRPVVRESRTLRRIRSIGLINHEDHAEQLVVSLDASSPIVLDLQLNRDLITDNFYVRHHSNGTEEFWRPEISSDNPSLPMCHYRGIVRNATNSWATLSTCSGLSGAVFDGLALYYIEPLNHSIDGDHSWKKHPPGLNSMTPRCDEDHHHHQAQMHSTNHVVKVKRQITKSDVQEAFSGVQVLELVLVVDYAIYLRNGRNMHKVLKRVFDIVNVIKEIYSTLPVSVMLVGVIVWSEGDRIHIGKNASQTLSDFKHYCDHNLHAESHDTAQLMTGVEADHFNGLVGRAYVGTLCNFHESCGIAVDSANSPAAMTASIMSHEMGHNFGMNHDNYSRCHCPMGDCVMVAAIGQPTKHWSSCSRELIQSLSRDKKYNCLRNQPSRCGNMVVDPEEECDCGLPNFCRNQCCDPHTCQFSRRSLKVQCAHGGCCDLMTCQLEMPGVECRSAESQCDIAEYCFGNSSTCPSDLHKFDGIKCDTRKVCIDKVCSRDSLRKINGPLQCPSNCTNGGFCNNLGKCHCPDGFNPPFCHHYGMGGSEDGGPSVDPKVRRLFQIELYIIFLAIIPIIIFLLCICFTFLHDDQKKSLGNFFRNGVNSGLAGRLMHPVPFIQSTSVDKSDDQPKRDFSNWVKNRVGLTLPRISMPPVANGPSFSILSPSSGCSTATITLSALNTPADESHRSTPTFPHRLPQSSCTAAGDKKEQLLLTPPIPRVVRPAPPPPPPPVKNKPVHPGFANSALALEADVVNNVKKPPRNNQFPLPPPSSAKPALIL